MTVIKPEMITKNITRHDVLPLSFLKKTAYTGSKRGLRYKLEKTEIEIEAADNKSRADDNTAESRGQAENTKPEKKTVLRCYVWNTPFSFDNTPKEEIRYSDFEFSDAGIDEAVAYLNKELDEAEKSD